jgi:hypothetical protein
MAEMDMVERVAARLWKAEAEDCGAPDSVAKGRTLDAYRDQAPELQARWSKFARAAIEAMLQPTEAMQAAMDEHAGTIAPIYAYEAAIDAALSDTRDKE